MTAAELAYKQSCRAIGGTRRSRHAGAAAGLLHCRAHSRAAPQHVELEDLVSAGVVGLLEASRSFDSSKNVQFKTFAKFRIRGAILDSLRETDWGSRLLRRRGREIAEATSRLEVRLGRQPAEAEIAEEMQIDLEHLRQHRRAARLRCRSPGSRCIDRERRVGIARCDRIGARPGRSRSIRSVPRRRDEEPIWPRPSPSSSEREQLILSLYYREELTMKEIAKVVGVALSRVSQIRQAAVIKTARKLAHLEQTPASGNTAIEEALPTCLIRTVKQPPCKRTEATGAEGRRR